MLKAVLFDLDGTLLDTVHEICARINDALAHFGFPSVTAEETRAMIGDGARELVRRAFRTDDHLDEHFDYFSKIFAESKNELVRPFEGIYGTLGFLKEKGVKLAVVTNKPQRAAENCAEKFFPDIFDFVGGDSGAFPCKPDPTLARYCALTLRAAPAECLFAGDGETDVRTAKNAGMRHAACLWGYRSKSQLKEAGAAVFASSPEELEKIVRKMCLEV